MRSQIDRLAGKFVEDVLAAIGKIPLGELVAVLGGEPPVAVPAWVPVAVVGAAVPKKRGLASKSPEERSIIARKAAETRRRNLAAAAAVAKKGGRS